MKETLIKIVIWMNMPSHHQSIFFQELEKLEGVSLEVRYYGKVTEDRIKLGWAKIEELAANESFIDSTDVMTSLATLSDWKSSIHIVPGFSSPFLKDLLKVLIDSKVRWCHWSEHAGKPFTRLLGYNYFLVNTLKPLFYSMKGYRSYAKKINKHALGALAISDLAKSDFIKWGVNENKIKISVYSLDATKVDENIDTSLNKNFKKFIYVGVLTKHKGIEYLIKSFYKLKSSDQWQLILVGSGKDYDNYVKLVNQLKLDERVVFTGSVKSDQVGAYIKDSDVFVLPTLFDGWGAVLNEAASVGKPLISTNHSGAACHLIVQGENGYLVDAKSVEQLTQAMQNYIDNYGLVLKHGLNSKVIFEEFTPSKCAVVFERNLRKLIQIS